MTLLDMHILLNEHNTQHTQSQSLCVVIKGLCYFYACGRFFFFFHILFNFTNWHVERSHMSCFLKTNPTHKYVALLLSLWLSVLTWEVRGCATLK